jgi:hypothetical protein
MRMPVVQTVCTVSSVMMDGLILDPCCFRFGWRPFRSRRLHAAGRPAVLYL